VRLPFRKRKAGPGPVDRLSYPDDYTGPRNAWGLEPGPCRILRTWAGGFIILNPEGRAFTVGRQHVKWGRS
jgi:hypothetical protein